MVTGDIRDTAVAIAKSAGILENSYDEENLRPDEQYTVMEGKDFRVVVGGL